MATQPPYILSAYHSLKANANGAPSGNSSASVFSGVHFSNGASQASASESTPIAMALGQQVEQSMQDYDNNKGKLIAWMQLIRNQKIKLENYQQEINKLLNELKTLPMVDNSFEVPAEGKDKQTDFSMKEMDTKKFLELNGQLDLHSKTQTLFIEKQNGLLTHLQQFQRLQQEHLETLKKYSAYVHEQNLSQFAEIQATKAQIALSQSTLGFKEGSSPAKKGK